MGKGRKKVYAYFIGWWSLATGRMRKTCSKSVQEKSECIYYRLVVLANRKHEGNVFEICIRKKKNVCIYYRLVVSASRKHEGYVFKI